MSKHYINDDIITYNPRYIKEHYDSSEFGDHGDDAPNASFVIGAQFFKKFVTEKDVSNKNSNISKCQHIGQNVASSVVSLTVPCHHCGRLVKNCKEILRFGQALQDGSSNQGTSNENIKKKLSGIFQQSNNRKMASTAQENNRNAINNTRVYCPDCRQRQIRKFYRKQQRYRPVNMNEDNAPLPLEKTQTPFREPTKTHFCNTDTVCANESKVRKKKIYKYMRDYEHNKEPKQVNLKYRPDMSRLRNRSQQYSRYAVYNSQCCQARDNDGATTSACCKMPVVPSFWEFMFNKLSAKYQEALNLTACEDCRSINCNMIRQPKTNVSTSQETSATQTETYEFNPDNQSSRFNSQTKMGVKTSKQNSECQTNKTKSGRRGSIFDMLSPRTSQQASPTTSNKSNSPLNSQSKCAGKCCSKTTTYEKPVTKLPFSDNNKSCQLSHEGLTKALKEKYNGEVLCIHNPPCILINGCVNLPHQAPKPLNIWQITTARRADPKMSHRLDICPLASVVLQCGQEENSENSKHICNHSSQCEVVPICYKSLCSPEFTGSCEHDPTCNRIPVCLLETEEKITRFSCEDMPLGSDIPECTSSFGLSELGGNAKVEQEASVSNGSTQVLERHLQLICHHKPRCIMIPKCLGRIMLIRRKGGAIPDCIHQPPCEYIPACRRNYVKMLAACSYTISPRPQCRIT